MTGVIFNHPVALALAAVLVAYVIGGVAVYWRTGEEPAE